MLQTEVVVEAFSVQECKEKGAQILGVTADKVDTEVLEEGKKGFLGRGKPYRVKVFIKQEEVQQTSVEEVKATEKQEIPQQQILGEFQGEYGIYTFQNDGLYVVVPPPAEGEQEIEYVQLLEETHQLGFANIDLDALGVAVGKMGSKVKIAGPQPKRLLLKKSIKVDEPKTSYVVFEFKNDGVYLKPIFKSGSNLSYEKVIEEITYRKLSAVDYEMVKFAIEGPGEPVKIAPPQDAEIKKNGFIEIELTADKMQAKLIAYPPFGGKPITEMDVLKTLQQNNIKFIPEDVQVQELIEAAKFHKSTLTIFGKKPTIGNDAQIKYLFESEPEKKGPVELEDGRVDYRDLGIVHNVHKGDILAQKTPPTYGKAGETVDGEEIPALPGRDLEIPIGKGAELTEDGMNAIASLDGSPAIISGKVCVLQVYEVKNDVDMSVGNIDFVGNVIVRGDITSGFTVKAKGNIDVFGNVEDAYVEAEGKITIRGGIYGRGKGLVKSMEDIIVRFVERGNLKAQGSVKVGEAVMHSNITAGKKVSVGGKRGLIVGGMVRAGEVVEARTIGSHLATPTEIEVGVDPELREELKVLEKKIAVDQENLNKTQHAINTLKELQKKIDLSEDKKELLLKLTRTQFQLMAQLKQAVQRKSELDEATKTTVQGKVSAADRIYSGVRVTIKNAVKLIDEELRYITLIEKNNEIKQGSFR